MNIIDTTQIVDPATEQPWTGPSLAFLQAATSEMIVTLASTFIGNSYNSAIPYALTGIQGPSAPITGGYILWQGEVYQCPGFPGTITITAQFNINVSNVGTPDPTIFSDNSSHNVHNKRRILITDSATPGAFNYSNVVFITAPGVVPTISNATIINSWTNFVTVKYYKNGPGVLFLDGVITGGVGVPTSTVMFNLPVGYRPLTQKICSVICNDAGRTPQYEPCLLRINTNGDVEALQAQSAVGTLSIYLAGVSIQLSW